ncbi:uncharacterized protein [Anoplolepis gracilipes]
MEAFICNRCFSPMYRGKMPYNITQCSHLFCQDCLQQVKRQCSQCKYANPAYLPLEQPVMPKKISLFTPSFDILETLLNVERAKCNQLKITMEHFYKLDNKYEMLKKNYFQLRHNLKLYTEKRNILKTEKKKFDKALLQLVQSTPKSTIFSTPKTLTNSNTVSTYSSNTRYSSGSWNRLKFSNLNLSDVRADDVSTRSANRIMNQRKVNDDFCTSNNNKPLRSTNIFFA